MRRLSFLLLCAALHALSFSVGCGGGEETPPDAGPYVPPLPDSGTPDAGPPPDAGPVDLVPPQVVSYSPANNSVAVPPETPIEVVFNEPMRPDRGQISLQPSTGVPNNGLIMARPENWDAARRKVTFTFPQGLPLRAQLTVTIGGFVDAAGNLMQGSTTFGFGVSDGEPPRVTASSPAEGATDASPAASELSLTFNEPMDTTVGTLTPTGGMTLGPISWSADKMIATAPITGGMAYNSTYSGNLTGFQNANLKAPDWAPYLMDGKLDFSTGSDTTRPTVVEASPAEGATGVLPENTNLIVFTFSEPMDKNLGRAELVDGTTRTVLSGTWAQDALSVTYDVRFLLRYNVPLRIALIGFKDRPGNTLNTTVYLGSNGMLDFTTAPDNVKPHVVESDPVEGAEIYPVEVYLTGSTPPTGYRKVFTFRFNEPMDTSVTRVVLQEIYNPSAIRNLDGVWSEGGLKLTVTVYPATAETPLLEGYFYTMDLTALKDRNGNLYDSTHPTLGNGKLDFKTQNNSTVLNQACAYALTGNPTAVTASGSTASPPRADVIHRRYLVTLPSSGTSYSGYVRMQLATEQWHTIFMDRDVPVAVTDATTQVGRPVTPSTLPPACPSALTHSARFETTQNPAVNVRMGPINNPSFHFVVEAAYY